MQSNWKSWTLRASSWAWKKSRSRTVGGSTSRAGLTGPACRSRRYANGGGRAPADAARPLIKAPVSTYGRLQIIWADGGYLGTLVNWVKQSRPFGKLGRSRCRIRKDVQFKLRSNSLLIYAIRQRHETNPLYGTDPLPSVFR